MDEIAHLDDRPPGTEKEEEDEEEAMDTDAKPAPSKPVPPGPPPGAPPGLPPGLPPGQWDFDLLSSFVCDLCLPLTLSMPCVPCYHSKQPTKSEI